jgi:hypothetical protein
MTLRISLAPAAVRRPQPTVGDFVAEYLLSDTGAGIVLGASEQAFGLVQPISATASSLFGPRGACTGGERGPLFVCDTGHHRLLIWRSIPQADCAPADLLIGQPDFGREGRNAKGEIEAATLNVPTGVAAQDGILAVADAWNHRILIWHSYPESSNQPADVVLGQTNFEEGDSNRGADRCRSDTLNWCYGVAIVDGRLIVADTGNRRVLIWNRIPEWNGEPADIVLGQLDFTTRDENAGTSAGPLGMRWPHGIAVAGDSLLVSDAGNNRIMVWKQFPPSSNDGKGWPCDFVLGQADATSVDHNRAAYYPDSNAMSMPYGVAVHGEQLIVADTANSRLLGFDLQDLATGSCASHLAAQPSFTAKGDNRWGAPMRDSVCWPYGVAACGNRLVVADSGNNRVLLWDFAS